MLLPETMVQKDAMPMKLKIQSMVIWPFMELEVQKMK